MKVWAICGNCDQVTPFFAAKWTCSQVTRPDNGSMLFVFPEKDQLLFTNYNTFTQTVGSKILVSAKDMPETETISPMDLAEMMTAAANLDEEDMALAEEALKAEDGEGEEHRDRPEQQRRRQRGRGDLRDLLVPG